jgi:hypothetical protein
LDFELQGPWCKICKELDCGLVSEKVMGLIAKCQGELIIGRIIFLKKTLWTKSIERWTELGVAHRGLAAWTAQSFGGAWPLAAPCAGAQGYRGRGRGGGGGGGEHICGLIGAREVGKRWRGREGWPTAVGAQ